jgi:hypothetical protein
MPDSVSNTEIARLLANHRGVPDVITCVRPRLDSLPSLEWVTSGDQQ